MVKKLLILALLLSSLHATSWEGEYWQDFNTNQFKSGRCKLYFVVQMRFDKNVSRFAYLRLSENFAYQALPNLDLELHYSFFTAKSFANPRFRNRHRLELEVNPSAPITEALTVKWRNRLEWLKEQSDSKIYAILRHRTALALALEDWGRLTQVQMSDEVFYDFTANKISQNRFIPLRLSFNTNCNGNLDLYYMLRSVFSFGLDRWHHSCVLGSELSF